MITKVSKEVDESLEKASEKLEKASSTISGLFGESQYCSASSGVFDELQQGHGALSTLTPPIIDKRDVRNARQCSAIQTIIQ